MNKKERKLLRAILREYIPESLQLWQEQFPDDFYSELFRLNGWELSESGIQEHPFTVAKWTDALVYEQLPSEVLRELNREEPEESEGWLLLASQIREVLTLFKVSDDMEEMWDQFEKLKSREHAEVHTPFDFDEQGHTKEPIYEEEKLSDFNKKLKTALEYKPPKGS